MQRWTVLRTTLFLKGKGASFRRLPNQNPWPIEIKIDYVSEITQCAKTGSEGRLPTDGKNKLFNVLYFTSLHFTLHYIFYMNTCIDRTGQPIWKLNDPEDTVWRNYQVTLMGLKSPNPSFLREFPVKWKTRNFWTVRDGRKIPMEYI